MAKSTPVWRADLPYTGSVLYPKLLERRYFVGSGFIGGIAGMHEAMSPALLESWATSSNDLLWT